MSYFVLFVFLFLIVYAVIFVHCGIYSHRVVWYDLGNGCVRRTKWLKEKDARAKKTFYELTTPENAYCYVIEER